MNGFTAGHAPVFLKHKVILDLYNESFLYVKINRTLCLIFFRKQGERPAAKRYSYL